MPHRAGAPLETVPKTFVSGNPSRGEYSGFDGDEHVGRGSKVNAPDRRGQRGKGDSQTGDYPASLLSWASVKWTRQPSDRWVSRVSRILKVLVKIDLAYLVTVLTCTPNRHTLGSWL